MQIMYAHRNLILCIFFKMPTQYWIQKWPKKSIKHSAVSKPKRRGARLSAMVFQWVNSNCFDATSLALKASWQRRQPETLIQRKTLDLSWFYWRSIMKSHRHVIDSNAAICSKSLIDSEWFWAQLTLSGVCLTWQARLSRRILLKAELRRRWI